MNYNFGGGGGLGGASAGGFQTGGGFQQKQQVIWFTLQSSTRAYVLSIFLWVLTISLKFYSMKQPAFGAQTSQFSFGKAATTSSGFNTPQQTGAFNLGGQTGATGNFQ
jgi:hypothetical protein